MGSAVGSLVSGIGNTVMGATGKAGSAAQQAGDIEAAAYAEAQQRMDNWGQRWRRQLQQSRQGGKSRLNYWGNTLDEYMQDSARKQNKQIRNDTNQYRTQASKSIRAVNKAYSKAAKTAQAGFSQARDDISPWRQQGLGALNQLTELSRQGPDLSTQSPQYRIMQQRTEKELRRQAAASGGYESGGFWSELAKRTNENLQLDQDRTVNRWQSRLQPLQSLANMGQQAANSLSDLAVQKGQYLGANAVNRASNLANMRSDMWNNILNMRQNARQTLHQGVLAGMQTHADYDQARWNWDREAIYDQADVSKTAHMKAIEALLGKAQAQAAAVQNSAAANQGALIGGLGQIGSGIGGIVNTVHGWS